MATKINSTRSIQFNIQPRFSFYFACSERFNGKAGSSNEWPNEVEGVQHLLSVLPSELNALKNQKHVSSLLWSTTFKVYLNARIDIQDFAVQQGGKKSLVQNTFSNKIKKQSAR